MPEVTTQDVLDQLQAEVHALETKLAALEKRLAALEAFMPKTMTVDQLWNKEASQRPAKRSSNTS